ncbi:MAG: NUDIX hydrolase, partial [Ekhidna sp.]|nr:NUDIX hydrolase [Ekhidna sp.]
MNSDLSQLGNNIYSSEQEILVAVDSIIFGVQGNSLHLLLFKREVEPLAGEWSLIGSFIKPDEGVNQAARRVLQELTGLEDVFMKQFHCFGDLTRDPGGRVISIAYWSLIRIDQNNRSFDAKNHKAKWVPFSEIPTLVLDHGEMVKAAIHELREQARFHPIG